MGYRSAKSYRGKTPEARERQMSGLKQYKGKKGPKIDGPPALSVSQKTLSKLDIIAFATEYLGVSFEERPAQQVMLKSLYGLRLTAEEIEICRELTTNEIPFEETVEKTEADWAVGARGGKSTLVSVIALYESICRAHIWRKYLQEKETGYAVITATRQKQCEDIVQDNCSRLLRNSRLAFMIVDDLKAELSLKNGMRIASCPCNSTAARGLPIFLLIFDEIAHYRTEGIKADETIHNALRPRQAQFPGAKCLKISTVGAKQGLFWTEVDEGFQVPGRLTIQAPTRLVNPLIPQEFIDKEYRRDPDNAAREFDSVFAETTEGFFASCADKLKECFELSENFVYQGGQKYFGSIDQSGLRGRDQFAFAIAHNDYKTNKIIEDVLRTWDTKDSDLILEEIKQLCVAYKIRVVTIDKYAVGWVQSALEKKGLEVTVRDKLAVIYTNFKTIVISGRLWLPDYPSLRKGLMQTQAYYGKSNSLSIAHERTTEGHGDAADATVAAVYYASKDMTVSELSQEPPGYQEDEAEDWDALNYGLRRGRHNVLNYGLRRR